MEELKEDISDLEFKLQYIEAQKKKFNDSDNYVEALEMSNKLASTRKDLREKRTFLQSLKEKEVNSNRTAKSRENRKNTASKIVDKRKATEQKTKGKSIQNLFKQRMRRSRDMQVNVRIKTRVAMFYYWM